MKRILFILLAYILFQPQAFSQKWIPTSGPGGRQIYKIAVHPINSKIIYAICYGGFYGVYKSTDAGNTWVVETKGLDLELLDGMYRGPNDLVVDKTYPETLFVAIAHRLGEKTLNNLYRSIDGGNQWFPILAGNVSSVYADNKLVIASIDSNLMVSTDAGTTWRLQKKQALFLKILHDSDNTTWFGSYKGFFKSADTGRTITAIDIIPFMNTKSFDVAYSSGQKHIVVSTIFPNANSFPLYLSSDGGITWTSISNGLPYDSLSGWPAPILDVKINHHNPSEIFVASMNGGIYYSDDYGATWKNRNNGIDIYHFQIPKAKTLISCFNICKNSDSIIYAGTYNDGLFLSTNKGITWSFKNIPSSEIMILASSHDNKKILAAGNAGLDIFNGESWIPSSLRIGQIGSAPTALSISPYNTSNTIACLENSIFTGILYRSTDSETTWKKVFMPKFEAVVKKIVYHPADSNIVYTLWVGAPFCALLKSNNGGDTWYELNFPRSIKSADMAITSKRKYILDIYGAIYAAEQDDSLWTQIRASTDFQHTVIRVDPSNENILYIGGNSLFKSLDCGISWDRMSFNKLVIDLVIDSTSGAIFIGTFEEGVWYSLDKGMTYHKLPDLPSERIQSMCWYIQESKKYLSVGTKGAGVYLYEISTILDVKKSDNVVAEYMLSQNYPNPFNPTTQIEYQLPQTGFVTLRIYDLLGREITKLVNELKDAGTYSIQWNASQFASGMYFAKMTSGDFSSTKKLLLMK